MARKPAPHRIAELEDELRQREARVAELTSERDDERALVAKMREHVEDSGTLIESWIEAFDMVLGDDGKWRWRASFVEGDDWFERYHALLREWNKFVPEYNAAISSRNVGRPLAASDAQIIAVLKLHKAGTSLRDIAAETSLGLRTVRTIIDKRDGVDRATVKHLARIDPDRKLIASWRARKRVRDALPKRINAALAQGHELIKQAKGLK